MKKQFTRLTACILATALCIGATPVVAGEETATLNTNEIIRINDAAEDTAADYAADLFEAAAEAVDPSANFADSADAVGDALADAAMDSASSVDSADSAADTSVISAVNDADALANPADEGLDEQSEIVENGASGAEDMAPEVSSDDEGVLIPAADPAVTDPEEPVSENAASEDAVVMDTPEVPADITQPETTADDTGVGAEDIAIPSGEDEQVSPEQEASESEEETTEEDDDLELFGVVASGTCGENLTWTLDEDGVLTISGSGEMVSYGGQSWKYYKSQITSLHLEDGVTSIDDSAFSDCTNLTNITSLGVHSIGLYAFQNCSSLANVVLPNAISIAGQAFKNCISLQMINLPKAQNIDNLTFNGCSNLTTVILPSATSIGDFAFQECSKLENIDLPNVEQIGKYAFNGCSALTTFQVSSLVTLIDVATFRNCSSLKDIELPESIIHIGDSAFYNCTSLEEMLLPDSVITLGEASFYGCSNLTSFIGTNITNVGEMSFGNCINLTELDLSSAIELGRNAFFECYNLETISLASLQAVSSSLFSRFEHLKAINLQSTKTIGDHAFSQCVNLTSVKLPNVESIGSYAFAYCYQLQNISLSSHLSTIGNSAFIRCPELATVFYYGTEADWAAISTENGNDCLLTAPSIIYNVCFHENTIQPVAAKAATLTETGYTAHYQCSNCGTRFRDANGEEEITLEDIMTPQLINLSGAKLNILDSQIIYSGLPQEPEISVSIGTTILEKGKDYLVSYQNNINAGTATATITALDGSAYGGSQDISFTIEREKVTPKIVLSSTSFTYNQTVQKPEIMVLYGPIRVPESGYNIEYSGNSKDAGIYSITVSLKGNYQGTATAKYTIHPKSVTPDIILSSASFTYDGTDQKPKVTSVKDGTSTLSTSDYSIIYSSSDSITVGTYWVTVILKGNYSGYNKLSYVINPKKITPTVTLSATSYVYNGKAKKPTVNVTDGDMALVNNQDYTITYAAGRKVPGAYKVTVTLMGNYNGSKAVSFQIVPKATTVSKATGASKSFTVKWKKQATQTTGYQIQYSTSKTFASGNKTVTVSKPGTTSKKITKLKAKKTYYVRIRTYKKVGKKTYYSAWSKAKAVKTK